MDAFEHAVERTAGVAELCDDEREDFREWLLHSHLDPDADAVDVWRGTAEYEQRKLERLADGCACDGQCTCTYDGEGLSSSIPGVDCDYIGPEDVAEAPSSPLTHISPSVAPAPAYLLDRGNMWPANDVDAPSYVCVDAAMAGCESWQDCHWVKEHLQRMAHDERAFLAWEAQHGATRDAELAELESTLDDFYWAFSHEHNRRAKWQLRKRERLDDDRTRTVGENELGIEQPLLSSHRSGA